MKNYILDKALYFYMDRLKSEEEKNIYKLILRGLLNFEADIELRTTLSDDTVSMILEYVLKDRPDIFWYGNQHSVVSRGHIIMHISPQYLYSQKEAESMIRKMTGSKFFRELDALLAKKDSSFGKALVAYEYIIKNAEYEVRAIGKTTGRYREYSHGIHGIVLEGKAVCSGYAKTYQYFLTRHNVPCTVVSGKTGRGRHEWNLVQLSGDYYYVDTTWGDPVMVGGGKDPDYISYDFFCITTKMLEESHRPKLDYPMPICTATDYNYYRFFDIIDDSFSVERVATRILTARRKKEKEAFIKYSNRTAFRTAVKKLFEEDEIFHAFRLIAIATGEEPIKNVSYHTNEENLTIRIKI